MMTKAIQTLLASLLLTTTGNAQGTIQTEYNTTSSMYDEAGKRCGTGDMLRVKGRYALPLSAKVNELRQPTVWTLTLTAAYAWLAGEGEARSLNPSEVVNAGLNLSHTRPLSARWQLLASLGAGVYAPPSEVAWQSILANGSALFVYSLTDNFRAGVGVALTNSYGAPMLLPVGYIAWQTRGRTKLSVDILNGLNVKASTKLTSKIGLTLNALEFDGLSAVRKIDDKYKIYASTSLRSSLSPTFQLSSRTTLQLVAGCTWRRSARLSERTIRSFFDNFAGNSEDKYHFRPAWHFSLGVSWRR